MVCGSGIASLRRPAAYSCRACLQQASRAAGAFATLRGRMRRRMGFAYGIEHPVLFQSLSQNKPLLTILQLQILF